MAGLVKDLETIGDGRGERRQRKVRERPVLPSARAAVGGLLLAVAAIGTFVTWQLAAGPPDRSYVVAQRAIRPGEQLAAEHIRLVPIDLPGPTAGQALSSIDAVVGRAALGPIGEGELVQTSQLSQAGSTPSSVEVSFALPRDRALDGRLRAGEPVDLYVTYGDHTTLVAEQVQVVALGDVGGGSMSSPGEVTVTLAWAPGEVARAELVHAVRAGDVTLMRSTGTSSGDDQVPADEVFQPSAPAAGS
jgi:hypothetical protein